MYLCSPFPLNGNERILHIDHDPYYRDRLTVRDLCYDFPEDEMYIDGLHAMQSHFYTHNVPVEIPIVRVMNAAHFLHAYVFQTTCSGDQMEYDALAYGSVGHDKKVMLVTLIVLAAMLKRTEGFRARQCRDVLLEDRSEDFYDGVSLYDQFLSSSEKHFAEEDFLLDTHNQIAQQEEIARLISENIQLKKSLTKMENQQNIQFKQDNNQGTIYNAPVYITYAAPQQAAAEPATTAAPESVSKGAEKNPDGKSLFCRITKAAYEKGVAQKVDDDLRSACITAPKLVKALKTNDALGYTDTSNLNSSDLYDMLNEHYGLSFKKHHFTVCRSKIGTDFY